MAVTVDETSIKEINILEHNESPGISDPAFDKIPTEIINTQSVKVDTVSGATVSSMAAAVTAHQNGAEVLIIEKMGKVGGNTMISGTAYNAVDPIRQSAQGIEGSPEKHYEQTLSGGDNLGDPELVKVLTDNAYSGIEWLESLGMQFKDEVFTVLGGLWPRAHKPVLPLGTG